MNFPAQGLAIIGPILFILLMIAFPLIGVFGGWKRAAYWGGGNLIFYLLGLGIWAGAHDALGNAMLGWLSSVIPSLPAEKLEAFASSITAPIFFLIIVVAGNLFLLLNYYFWFKRVAKIRRKDDKANLDNNTLPSKKYRIMSMVAGGVGMPVLMLPTTLSATQAAMFVTTSAETRANNAFAAGLYNGLAKISETFGGLSYYGITKSAQDFDALWAAQGLEKQVEPGSIPDPTDPGKTLEGDIQKVLGDVFDKGFSNIVTEVEKTTSSDVEGAVKGFANSWNALIEQAGNVVGPLLGSESATAIIKDIIPVHENPYEIPVATFDAIWGENGRFDTEYKKFIDEGYAELTRVATTQKGLENVTNAMETFYTFEDGITDEQKAIFQTKINTLIQLIVEVK